MKKSKATIDVDALDTMDCDIEAGQAKDPKIAVDVIDDARPSQREAQQPQVASRPNATALKDPPCVNSFLSPSWLTDCLFVCSANIFDRPNSPQTLCPVLDISLDPIPPPHAANDMEDNVDTTGMYAIILFTPGLTILSPTHRATRQVSVHWP